MSKSQKIDIAKIIVSAALYVTGFATGNFWFFMGAYAVAGYETIFEALMGIVHLELLDENFLMTIASLGALYCGQYPEAVAVMLFYQVGEFFEDYAVDNSRKSIAGLMDIKAEFATRLTDGREERVEPEELSLDDIILVRPGEKIDHSGRRLSYENRSEHVYVVIFYQVFQSADNALLSLATDILHIAAGCVPAS